MLLQRNGLTPADLAMVIPHQANQRILDATAERLGLPRERMASVIARYGNTTAATMPLALEDALARAGGSGGAICGVRWRWARGLRWGRRWCGGCTGALGYARKTPPRSIAARSSADSSSSAARTLSSACSTRLALGIAMTVG